MCVCCRCELAPIKTMEKVSFERKNGMQKEVFISTEATAQMSSVYLSGCNVFYTKHLLYSVIRFHFGKSSTLMNINVLFSLSHFFSLSLTQSKSFSMHLYMIILLFFHSHYCLNWNFHLLLFVFFFFFILSVQICCDGLQVLWCTRQEHFNQRYNGRNFTRGHKNSFFVCVCYFLF